MTIDKDQSHPFKNACYFILTHLIIPGIILVLMIIGLEYFQLDYAFTQLFYDHKTQNWPYKDAWLTQTVFHKWGQKLSISMGVIIFILFILSFLLKKLKAYKKAFGFLFLSSISGPVVIAILKSSTHIYCPWSLKIFGADKPYIKLFDSVAPSLPVGHCFPGGHAGGGFAFISLYYFLMIIAPAYRFYGLATGLVIGIVFALTQEMRGAHFISHDLTSLLICWELISILFIIFYRDRFNWKIRNL